MYPETDIRPIRVTREMLEYIRSKLPEPPEAKYEKFVKVYGLSPEMAKRMISSYRLDLFERIVESVKVSPTLVASTLENTIVELRREGVPVYNLSDDHLIEVFKLVSRNVVAKEAIPSILTHLAKHPSLTAQEAVKALGLTRIDINEARAVVREVAESMARLIEERGERAFGPIMGRVMKKLRGRVDGALVSKLVMEEIRRRLRST